MGRIGGIDERAVGRAYEEGGDDEEAHDHQQGLEHVRAGDGKETTDEGVGANGHERQENAGVRLDTEHRVEQLGSSQESRTHIEHNEEDGDGGREGAQHPCRVPEADLEELGNREDVVRGDGVTSGHPSHRSP